MEGKKIAKSTQEQAVAAWIGYLNQIRLDRLLASIKQQDINLSDAMKEMDEIMQEIHKLIISNRGGDTGIHGFIAEVAGSGIGNARNNILGKDDTYSWVNDNGPVDLRRNGVDIQQKFHISNLSLDAIKEHFHMYPDFLKKGGKYQIPKDQYDKIKYLLSIGEDQANKMPNSDGTFSLKQWKLVHRFFEDGEISFDSIEPSELEYKEVQRDKIDETLQHERESLRETDKEQRVKAQQQNKATVQEGAKATAVSAAIEGTTTLLIAIQEKRVTGKTIQEFDSDDWVEILQKAGIGTVKGSVRGSATYILTNAFNNSFAMMTETDVHLVEIANGANAASVSAMVTAAFGVAEQAHLYRNGDIDQQTFIENSEMLCAETAVSALSSYIGQFAIPVPVLGAIIGNAIGSTLYKIAIDGLQDKEQAVIRDCVAEINEHSKMLDKQYQELVESVRQGYEQFLEIIDSMYSADVKEAFEGSIAMAKYCGVPQEEILDTKEKRDSYFLD